MNKLYAYLPCYNEAGNIEALVEGWLSEAAGLRERGYELEVVPVDDKSTDQTLAIIRRLEEENQGFG